MALSERPHIVLFPFMSKGHTIPLVHLARLLMNRGIVVTVFTTKANLPFIARFLEGCSPDGYYNIIDLPFPSNIEGIPHGIESTDMLPSMSLFQPFAIATKLMQPYFEQALLKNNSSNAMCIISDGFLSWTLESANKFGIPRLVFSGMNSYVGAVFRELTVNDLLSTPESDDELITVTRFPWIKVTRNDLNEPFNQRYPMGPQLDFVIEMVVAMSKSYGVVMNSFYELEPMFLDYLNRELNTKTWCVGPLCLVDESPKIAYQHGFLNKDENPKWMKWLDQKLAQGSSVLYVAFGSQVEISRQQLEEVSKGLEESQVNFLWVVRNYERSSFNEFQDRVGERGMIVSEWVNQREILKHESIKGFVSHCGWNSVLESICAKVPILAWPMMNDQPLNTRMVVEEIKIGLRMETSDGTVKGFVKSDGLKKMVEELVEGEKGKEVRNKVKEVSDAAKEAMMENGSSWRTLNELIDELQTGSVTDRETYTFNG